MKKIIALALVMVLALSLAACGAKDAVQDAVRGTLSGSSGSSTPSSSSSAPAQTAPNSSDAPLSRPSEAPPSGGNTDGWENSFAEAAGIPTFFAPPECEVTFDANSPRTVTFTANSAISEDMFTSYAQMIFDLCRAASPDGLYNINYESMSKGDEVVALSDVYSSGSLIVFWYYTAGDYISQISLEATGDEITVKLNDVYNDKGELAKP